MATPGQEQLKQRLRLFAADRGGNLATMSAFMAPLALALAAIAIDGGSLYNEKRQVQALADISAIAGAAHIYRAEEAVLASLRDNRLGPLTVLGPGYDPLTPAAGQNLVTIETGRYEADGSTPAGQRFEPGGSDTNAVRVTIARDGARHFGEILAGQPRIAVASVASATPRAAISIGSRLARLEGGVLNSLLGALTGNEIGLTVMDYEALVDADVSLFGFLDALATEVDLQAGTYEDLLDAEVVLADVTAAAAATGQSSPRLRAALARYDTDAASRLSVPLSHVLHLGQAAYLGIGQGAGAFDATVGVMEFILASLVAANGANQLAVDLGATVPGLATARVTVVIGEPKQDSAWFALGERGTLVRTAQLRARIDIDTGGSGVLSGLAIRLPVYVEMAQAEAELKRVTCTDGKVSSAQVTIDARPGIASLTLGQATPAAFADTTRPPVFGKARIVDTPLIKVDGSARAEIANRAPTRLQFSAADIRAGRIKTVATTDVTTSLAASLIGDLDVTVSIVGLDLGLSGAVRSALATTLTAATPAIDSLLADVLAVLGMRLGEADIKVTGVTCGRAVLVQ